MHRLLRVLPALPVLPAFLATLILLAGCGPTVSDWRRCSFTVTEVAFQGFRENQTEWRVDVAAVNPNAKRLRVEGLHLWALMEGDTLARLKDPARIDLAPRDTTLVRFDVALPPEAWSKAMRTLRRKGAADLLITGDATVGTWLGTRTVRNAVREKHRIDLASMLGTGDFLRGLFGR